MTPGTKKNPKCGGVRRAWGLRQLSSVSRDGGAVSQTAGIPSKAANLASLRIKVTAPAVARAFYYS